MKVPQSYSLVDALNVILQNRFWMFVEKHHLINSNYSEKMTVHSLALIILRRRE